MGGMLGGGDPSGGGGVDSNVTLARMAQQIPGLGGILGQMGYTGPSGPQQPVGTGGMPTPSQQSGAGDIAKYGQNLMAGGGLGGAAPTAMAMPKPLQMPAPYAPQATPMQPIQNPYGGGPSASAAPAWGNRMVAGGANPQFFPYFR